MTRRTDTYRRALADLTAIKATLPEAERRMMDARASLPGAQAFDSPSVGGGTSSSPTERHALTGDTTQRDRDAFDKALRLIDQQTTILRRLVDAWTPHAPSARDRAQVERLNAEDTDAWCHHHRTFGTLEPTHRTGTVNGNLNVSMPLCRWCYDRVRDEGLLPSADRMERLAAGRADRVRA